MTIEKVRYEKLGELVLRLVPDGARKVLLYAEFEEGVIAPSLFYERGSELYYIEPDDDLFDELHRLQQLFGSEVKAIEFEVQESKFRTHFTYGDGFDSTSNKSSRTIAILQIHFGSAKVRY